MRDCRKAVNGHHRKRGARFVFALLLAASTARGEAVDLDGVRRMAAGGAPGLALQLLDRGQPSASEQLEQWLLWERLRVELLQQRRAWGTLAERLGALPAGLPAGFLSWAATVRAEALLAAGEPAAARALAARLLWEGSDAESHHALRQLVMRSYLAERRSQEAYDAMLRLRHDYGSGSREEAMLRARVLLMNGLARDAQQELAGHQADPELEALALAAQLRAAPVARRVLERAEALLSERNLPPSVRMLIMAVAADAAEQAGELARAVLGWEFVLAHPAERDATLDDLYPIAGDRLWAGYLGYAARVANQQQLLIGDDAAWLQLAATDSHRYPVRTRSLRAAVALQGATAEQREAAHAALMESLHTVSGGERVLEALYQRSDRFARAADLPLVVRYQLADRAVERSDLADAARLLEGLEQPPGGADAIAWQLRRARIFTLGGEPERGAALLRDLAAETALSPLLRDRLVQVVFDLQSAGRHDDACDVLERLLANTADPLAGRELLFWMADSRRAQARHAEAARLYLESALALGPDVLDPWAQTARYQAAKSLAEAGLAGDAQALLEGLLAITDDPQRHRVLQHEITQLGQRRGAEALP